MNTVFGAASGDTFLVTFNCNHVCPCGYILTILFSLQNHLFGDLAGSRVSDMNSWEMGDNVINILFITSLINVICYFFVCECL